MSIFRQAAQQKLRFSTTKGLATVEDLWDLPLHTLRALGNDTHKELKEDEQNFFDEQSVADALVQLKFDILKYIISYKNEEYKAERKHTSDKAELDELLQILGEKNHNAKREKSVPELTKMIKKLQKQI